MFASQEIVSRRKFCAGACQAVSCAAVASIVSGCESGSPTSPGGSSTPLAVLSGRFTGSAVEVTIAGSALADSGGAVLVDSIAGVFLLARTADTTFSAIDAVCSHQSCTVTGADGAAYVCPCHGSRYDRNGRVLNGPAIAALRRFSSSVANGIVTIAL
jgi:cytochrome b6-f complex iron-sulfur subunit